jgi:hypothetical protein
MGCVSDQEKEKTLEFRSKLFLIFLSNYLNLSYLNDLFYQVDDADRAADEQDEQDDQEEEKMIRTELMNISTKKPDEVN